MRALIRFALITNLIGIVILTLGWFTIDAIHAIKPIDLMFLSGVGLWGASTLIRFSNRRVRKGVGENTIEITDPQLVLSGENLATRFLVAGLLPILGAIIWGFFY